MSNLRVTAGYDAIKPDSIGLEIDHVSESSPKFLHHVGEVNDMVEGK